MMGSKENPVVVLSDRDDAGRFRGLSARPRVYAVVWVTGATAPDVTSRKMAGMPSADHGIRAASWR